MTKKKDHLQSVEDKVLRAAARLFRAKGFKAATVRDIARAANMLPGSLHYRYPSKTALLVALMERGVEEATKAVRAAIDGTRDPVERVRLGLRAHLRLLLSGDDAVYVLLNEWRALEGRARESVIRVRDRYEALFGTVCSTKRPGRGGCVRRWI
ncbi:MAG: TetR/AcrR family transcriptional regulator [Deltaproteobacteria bacterium]|nr:TetR/AcrR family transcriptional regulator [Deltaproteobacteria bacterium]